MYRARVESVSGLQVRAGGKWLNCIGNRAFKVGDLVWTDGRCVYGNDRETQAPLVIANPVKEDLAIPIQIGKNAHTYKKSLKFNCETSEIKLLTNDKNNRAYSSSNSTILAMNADESGNIFCIVNDGEKINITKNSEIVKTIENPQKSQASEESEKLLRERTSLYPQAPQGTTTKSYYIRISGSAPISYDDGVTAFELEWWHRLVTAPETKITYEDAHLYDGTAEALYRVYPSKSTCDWAFIENEHNWAVVIAERARGFAEIPLEVVTMLWWDSPFEDGILVSIIPICNCENWIGHSYLINDSGSYLLFKSSRCEESRALNGGGIEEGSWAWYISGWLGIRDKITPYHDAFYNEVPLNCNAENFIGAKFPMPDGFSFVVNSVSIPEDVGYYDEHTAYPKTVNITVYTKGGSAIFTGDFFSIPYVTACKVSSSKFILAVEYPIRYASIDSESYALKSGLYEVQKGVATLIDSNRVANQALRPMKKYKNWWERIQTLE